MRKGSETGIAALDTTELAAILRSDVQDKRQIQEAALRVVRHHDALTGLQLATVPNDEFERYVKERRARKQVSWHDRSDAGSVRLDRSSKGTASLASLPSAARTRAQQGNQDVMDKEESELRSLSKAKSEQFLRTLDKLRSGRLKNGGYTASDDVRHHHQRKGEIARASSQKLKTLNKSLMGDVKLRKGVVLEPDILQLVHDSITLEVRCPTLLQVSFCAVKEAFIINGICWKRERLAPMEYVGASTDDVIAFIRKRLRLSRSLDHRSASSPLCLVELQEGRTTFLHAVKDMEDEVADLLQTKKSFRIRQHVASGGKLSVEKKPELECCFVISGISNTIDGLISITSLGSPLGHTDFEITQVRGQAYNHQVRTACKFVEAVNRQATSPCERWHAACLDFTKDRDGQWWLLAVRAASKLPQNETRKKRVVHLPLPPEPCPGEFCKSKTPALAKRIPASMLCGGNDSAGAKVKVCIHCFCTYHRRMKERREEEQCRSRPCAAARKTKHKGQRKRKEDIDLFTGRPVNDKEHVISNVASTQEKEAGVETESTCCRS